MVFVLESLHDVLEFLGIFGLALELLWLLLFFFMYSHMALKR